jgi:hypothetical protein
MSQLDAIPYSDAQIRAMLEHVRTIAMGRRLVQLEPAGEETLEALGCCRRITCPRA